MADQNDVCGEEQTGPPASNLRKVAARTLSAEINMAQVSEKTEKEKVKTPRTKKAYKKRVVTPSVKQYFTSESEYSSIVDENEEVKENQGETWTESESDIDHDEYAQSMNNTMVMKQHYQQRQNDEVIQNELKSQEEEVIKQIDNLDDMELRDMIREMCITMRSIKMDMAKQKSELETSMQEFKKQKNDEIKDLKRSIKQCQDGNKLMTKVIINQDQAVQHLSKKTTSIEYKTMRPNLLFSGLTEAKGENCIQIIKSFIKDKLKVTDDIKVRSARRIGKGDNRPIEVVLKNPTDKGVIYKHTSNIKGVKNDKNQGYFIEDQLPEVLAEQKRKLKQKVKYNKTLIDSQQQEINWKKGNLIVDGTEYKPKIKTPANSEILKMKQQDVQRVLAYKTFEGQKKEKDGNIFLGFAAKVFTTENVMDVYRQMKYRFADAHHVICAYRILDPDAAHMQDAVDDGEIGASRRMLEMMFEEDFKNCAVFVIRFHSGMNLGPVRFDLINGVAKSAIQSIPGGIEASLSREGTLSAGQYAHIRDPRPISLRRNARSRGASTAAKALSFNNDSWPTVAQAQWIQPMDEDAVNAAQSMRQLQNCFKGPKQQISV